MGAAGWGGRGKLESYTHTVDDINPALPEGP